MSLLQVVADKKLPELRLREIDIGADVVSQLAEATLASDTVAGFGSLNEAMSMLAALILGLEYSWGSPPNQKGDRGSLKQSIKATWGFAGSYGF